MILGVSQQVAVSQRINSGLWLPNQAAGWREADVAGVRRAFLLIANWKADKDKNGEIANLPLSTSLVQNGKSLQHRTSLDSGCPFRVALEANVIDFQVGMLRKMGMLDEPELRIETPSMLEARGAHCTVEELYILPASAWSALFEQNGMPKSIWSRVIVPTIVLRRAVVFTMMFNPVEGYWVTAARATRHPDLDYPFSERQETARFLVTAEGVDADGSMMVKVHVGDAFMFPRAMATSLALTGLALFLAVFDEMADVDIRFADELRALLDLSNDPNGFVTLADSSRVHSLVLASYLTDCLTTSAIDVQDRVAGTPAAEPLGYLLRAWRNSMQWIQ